MSVKRVVLLLAIGSVALLVLTSVRIAHCCAVVPFTDVSLDFTIIGMLAVLFGGLLVGLAVVAFRVWSDRRDQS